MTHFSTLGLSEPILRAVAAEGYTSPTPIQRDAIPEILAGHDVLGIAQTGTGKTAAFVLPLLHHLSQKSRLPTSKGCQALILAPTRELVQQIGACVQVYGRFLNLSHTTVIGGASMGAQIRAMARGVNLLIATPGRLLDHLGGGTIRLDHTETVVLDEVDQMLDLGFLPPIRRIVARLPRPHQTVFLSATMPKTIRQLADDFLVDAKEIAITPAARPVERIEQRVILVDTAAKRNTLVDLLSADDVGRTIVFTRTKHGADRVSAHLHAAGLPSAAIHGNKSQNQRERALNAFRTDQIRVLVATDIAARGIDVDGVSHVINFDLPNVPEAYVHRIGRTARAGASGAAISLCDPAERGLLRDIEKLIGRSLLSGADAAIVASEPSPGKARRSRPRKPQARGHHQGQPSHGASHGQAARTVPPAAAQQRHSDTPHKRGKHTTGSKPARHHRVSQG